MQVVLGWAAHTAQHSTPGAPCLSLTAGLGWAGLGWLGWAGLAGCCAHFSSPKSRIVVARCSSGATVTGH